jgi:FixJ family two-component response regulator
MTTTHQPRNYCHHRRRAGLARAQLFAHVVEGRLLTSRQIAAALGTSIETATIRAKRGPFPLTWASLQLARLPKNDTEKNA